MTISGRCHGASAIAEVSKFEQLMAGEQIVDGRWRDEARPVEWSPHSAPCGYGAVELTAQVVDPAITAGTDSRELHLVKGLLQDDELEQLRDTFDALGHKAADGARAAETHASVIVEDGRVVCPDLYGVLDEPLEQRILPYVRERYGAPHVAVADVLLRAYRHEDGRQALAPHFDASSYCTVIVPLNPGEYGGGLFVQSGADAASRLLVDSSFERGDALVHSFDVMHGVEVTSGSRYSLVLWLADCAASVRTASAPWLAGAAQTLTLTLTRCGLTPTLTLTLTRCGQRGERVRSVPARRGAQGGAPWLRARRGWRGGAPAAGGGPRPRPLAARARHALLDRQRCAQGRCALRRAVARGGGSGAGGGAGQHGHVPRERPVGLSRGRPGRSRVVRAGGTSGARRGGGSAAGMEKVRPFWVEGGRGTGTKNSGSQAEAPVSESVRVTRVLNPVSSQDSHRTADGGGGSYMTPQAVI